MKEIKTYLNYLKYEKGNSDKTIEGYEFDINTFFKEVKKEINDVTEEDIYEYIENLKKIFSHNTVIRKITAIKGLFRFCYIEKMIKNDPSNKIHSLKKEKRLPEVLSVEEIKKIIASFNYEPVNRRNQLIVKMLVATGARISEILNLEIKNLENFEFEFVKLFGKGSKFRLVPIYKTLEYEIKEYIEKYRPQIKDSEKSHLLFPAIRRENFWKILREVAKNLEINKNIHPHIFRHSAATMLLENGADIKMVQELLGHASISTTEIYTHVEKSTLKKIYENIKLGDEE